MKLKHLIGGLALAASSSALAVSLVSDPWTPTATQTTAPTHCTYAMDGAAKIPDVAVALDANQRPFCSFDIGGVSIGSHTVIVHFVAVSPWGRQEGDPSAPFTFARPGRPGVPSGMRITP